MNELLTTFALSFTAVFAAVGCILALAGLLHWGHNRKCGLLPYVFYPAITIVLLDAFLSGRNLSLSEDAAIVQATKPVFLILGSKIASLFLMCAAVERILNRSLQLQRKKEIPIMLGIALCIFYLTNVVSSALFASESSFSTEYLYTVVAAYAALLVTRNEGYIAIQTARNALFGFLVLGAVCILWWPKMVLITDYRGLISGLTTRYAGFSPSPNAIGPVIVVFLLCLWMQPYRLRWLNWLGWLLGVISLFFSQSKTSWLAFLVCIGCTTYYWHKNQASLRRIDNPSFKTLKAGLSTVFILTAFFIIAYLISSTVITGGTENAGGELFSSRASMNLLTLVGRTRIWEASIEEWRNNPIFGYGLTIWDSQYRAKTGLPDAFHSHNQFFQSLSSAGLVGVIGLVVYVGTLLWFVMRTARQSKGLSIALFVLIIFRSISEVPLSMAGYGLEQLTHLLLLMVIAAHFETPREAVMRPHTI